MKGPGTAAVGLRVPRFDLAARPFLVLFELTRACDLLCPHCRAEAIQTRHPDELTGAEVGAVLDDLAGLGAPSTDRGTHRRRPVQTARSRRPRPLWRRARPGDGRVALGHAAGYARAPGGDQGCRRRGRLVLHRRRRSGWSRRLSRRRRVVCLDTARLPRGERRRAALAGQHHRDGGHRRGPTGHSPGRSGPRRQSVERLLPRGDGSRARATSRCQPPRPRTSCTFSTRLRRSSR